MVMVAEQERTSAPIVTNREPKGPGKAGDKGSLGDQALTDAITLILVAWVLLFVLSFSLRAHNI